MPFKSKRQMRKFFAMERRGELKKGTARRWAHETPNVKGLPERVKKKKKGNPGRSKRHRRHNSPKGERVVW